MVGKMWKNTALTTASPGKAMLTKVDRDPIIEQQTAKIQNTEFTIMKSAQFNSMQADFEA
jgi:hypothetical protein